MAEQSSETAQSGASFALLQRPAVLVTLGVLLFLSVTVLSDRFLRSARLDLTDEQLYTLSDGTRTLLNSLDEPVRLTYYFSEDQAAGYPGLLAYGKRVEDLLRALDDASPAKVDLSVVDPEPFSRAEDNAVAAGLQGVPLGDGSTLYMGLRVADQLDGETVIPFFAEEREAYLEYDIVKAIATLAEDSKPSVAILSQLPLQFGPGGPQAMFSGRSAPYAIFTQLEEFFAVEMLQPDFDSLADYDLVMLIHPPVLNDDQLYLLEQYALTGGRMMVFVDPHAESTAQPQQAAVPGAGGPNASTFALLTHWGVSMAEGQIVADRDYAQRVQLQGPTGPQVKTYPLWLALDESAISDDDIATAPIKSLNLASAGALSLAGDSTLVLTPLVQSSQSASLVDASLAVGQPDPDSINRSLTSGDGRQVLLARLTGEVQARFAERAKAEGGADSGTVQVIIGSDVDLFEDRFWVQVQSLLGQRILQQIAGNGSLIINLADHMTGSDALLSLRARGTAQRPFDVVADLRRAAEARYAAEEEALQQKLAATEARLQQLQSGDGTGDTLLSPEAEAEIDRFRDELLETRQALRDVRGGLRREIEALEAWLIFVNTALVPLLLLAGAGLWVLWRRRVATAARPVKG